MYPENYTPREVQRKRLVEATVWVGLIVSLLLSVWDSWLGAALGF
jgi:hypothetical protein